jgi:hypothetical protein
MTHDSTVALAGNPDMSQYIRWHLKGRFYGTGKLLSRCAFQSHIQEAELTDRGK